MISEMKEIILSVDNWSERVKNYKVPEIKEI